MNTKLVESLVEIVKSLSEEERKIFENKLFFDTHEVTIKEIMNLAIKSHSFDFLNDEPELYTYEDGEPI